MCSQYINTLRKTRGTHKANPIEFKTDQGVND